MKFLNILFNISLIIFSTTTIYSMTNPNKAIINLTSKEQNVNQLEIFLSNQDLQSLNNELKQANVKLIKTVNQEHIIVTNEFADELYRERKVGFYPIKGNYIGAMHLKYSDLQTLIEETKNKMNFLEFIEATNEEENKWTNKLKFFFHRQK